MDQLEMPTISADDADDDQRSLEYGDAIPQPSFTLLAGPPRLSAYQCHFDWALSSPKEYLGVLLSNGKSKTLHLFPVFSHFSNSFFFGIAALFSSFPLRFPLILSISLISPFAVLFLTNSGKVNPKSLRINTPSKFQCLEKFIQPLPRREHPLTPSHFAEQCLQVPDSFTAATSLRSFHAVSRAHAL
jgi:hypothetical protein